MIDGFIFELCDGSLRLFQPSFSEGRSGVRSWEIVLSTGPAEKSIYCLQFGTPCRQMRHRAYSCGVGSARGSG